MAVNAEEVSTGELPFTVAIPQGRPEANGIQGAEVMTSEIKESNEPIRWLKEKLVCLSQTLENVATRTESLKQTVKELEHEIEDNELLMTLQNQVDELSSEWREVMDKGNTDNLLDQFGLIAVYVEQAICSHVLPEVFVADANASLHDLLTFLNDNDMPKILPLDPDEYDCEKVLHDARERWIMVCDHFNFPDEWKTRTGGWKIYDHTVPGDIIAIDLLKVSGLGMPCPSPVSLKYAEQNVESIKDEMPLWQFDLVVAFIGSLRDNMTKSGLHHDNLLN